MSTNEEIAAKVQELSLDAPHINYAHILELLKEVHVETWIVPDTTTTMAVAIYKDFVLAVGKAACVDPANFNEELGADAAIKRVMLAAEDKLWELEGWRLYRS